MYFFQLELGTFLPGLRINNGTTTIKLSSTSYLVILFQLLHFAITFH